MKKYIYNNQTSLWGEPECIGFGQHEFYISEKQLHGRDKPAFRNPEMLAKDVRRISAMSRGPVFILGDLRQAGRGYAQRFFDVMRGFDGPVITELFSPASREFLQAMADALPNFTLEVSLESHDPVVRHAFGKHYVNEPIERTLADALDVGARRLDVFLMSGLPQQTAESVLGTIDYCEELLKRFGKDGRLSPLIGDEARAAMKECLKNIQNGSYAKQFILEGRTNM